MSVPDLQNFRTQKAGILQEIIKIVKIGLQHTIHGFVAYVGLNIINLYLLVLDLNLAYGNRYVFVPGLLLLATPLVLIVLGAVNSHSMKFIYHRRTSQHWLGLLGQGLLVILLGYLLSVLWLYLLLAIYGRTAFSFHLLFIIVYHILLISTLGYATKVASTYFTGIALEVSSRDGQ